MDGEYTVTVTATDPSLASKTVTVTITVNDLNEAPTFATGLVKKYTVDEDQTNLARDEEATDAPTETSYTATDVDVIEPGRGRYF